MVEARVANYLACSTCGSNVPVPAGYPESISCPNCGQEYVREGRDGAGSGGFWEFVGGLFIGTFLIGPFIWTGLGRETAIEAIKRGAGVTRKKVEEWLKKGEEEKAG